jgi:hypothetical protein
MGKRLVLKPKVIDIQTTRTEVIYVACRGVNANAANDSRRLNA